MFESQAHPRLFALPPGADFPAELIAGLLARHKGPPEALARTEVFVNTARMRRRIATLFAQGPARLLPRLRLVTDLAADPLAGQAPTVSPLRRRLELGALIAQMIDSDPTVAPRAAVFDLADSLAELMDEMQGEGVSPDILQTLDVSDESGHWRRSLAFVGIVQRYFAQDEATDAAARQRDAIERRIAIWADDPPSHPVIVAGSTGSRGATARLMQAVARLPQGAVILPGFDFAMPEAIWGRLDDPLASEDHPQYRFARLMHALDLRPDQVMRWSASDPAPARNALVSLALRPAPVTDQWTVDGPALGPLDKVTAGIALIEATTPREEALAIALCLRQAVEDGRRAALITPDRTLTRQVAAALDRWAIIPDDSAGRPLALSPPGRFLRHVSGLFGRSLTSERLLTVLKHPLCNTGSGARGPHLRLTHEFELWLRRKGPAFPSAETVLDWAGEREPSDLGWALWLAGLLRGLERPPVAPLADRLTWHLTLAEGLTCGPAGAGSGQLWLQEAGRMAAQKMAELRAEAGFGADMGAADYDALVLSVLNSGEVRESERSHPDVMIWGTLEARVQGADLVILGGLNDGVWPQLPTPDPWLNRRMRQEAGLLLPERRVGLAAHDFQQAIAAREVVLTRATRDAEAETVVSRWVNRLTNLLRGLPGSGGPEALAAMRGRGAAWLDMARTLDADFDPVAPQPRPAPRPPVDRRPRQLSVTQIQTLIRDPYAIYARHVLNLRPLDPLRQQPDAPLRGTVIHAIFERFIRECPDPTAPEARAILLSIAADTLAAEVPWPATRLIWMARLERSADAFLLGEAARRREAAPILTALEGRASFTVPGTDFILTGKADRIDRRDDGRLLIHDYKTGTPPTPAEMQHFDKQLLLEAAMAEAGAFAGVPRATVAEIAHIGVGAKPVFRSLVLRDPESDEPLDPDRTIRELRDLLNAWGRRGRGFTSRRAMHKTYSDGDFDHLARFGEWDDTDPAVPEDVG